MKTVLFGIALGLGLLVMTPAAMAIDPPAGVAYTEPCSPNVIQTLFNVLLPEENDGDILITNVYVTIFDDLAPPNTIVSTSVYGDLETFGEDGLQFAVPFTLNCLPGGEGVNANWVILVTVEYSVWNGSAWVDHTVSTSQTVDVMCP
jgi:hypothetical protein